MAQFNINESKITNMTCVQHASQEINYLLDKSQAKEDYAPCCDCHGTKGKATCSRMCPCKKNGMKCSSCFPMKHGQCSNSSPVPIVTLQISSSLKSHTNVISKDDSPTTLNSYSLADQKMIEAFGAPLLNTDGKWMNDIWENIWKRAVKLRGKLYALPGGSVGRLFVSTLAAEVLELEKGKQKSEIPICFPPLILQRNKDIVKTADIRRLILRRLKLWSEK